MIFFSKSNSCCDIFCKVFSSLWYHCIIMACAILTIFDSKKLVGPIRDPRTAWFAHRSVRVGAIFFDLNMVRCTEPPGSSTNRFWSVDPWGQYCCISCAAYHMTSYADGFGPKPYNYFSSIKLGG